VDVRNSAHRTRRRRDRRCGGGAVQLSRAAASSPRRGPLTSTLFSWAAARPGSTSPRRTRDAYHPNRSAEFERATVDLIRQVW